MDELDPRTGPRTPDFAAPESQPDEGHPEPEARPTDAANTSTADPQATAATAAPLMAAGSGPISAVRPAGRRRWIVGGLVAAVAIVGAVAVVLILGAKPLPEALRYLPADSVVVLELRPELPGDQRQHLGNLLAHFPGFADQSTLTKKLDETFERIVSEATDGSVDYATRVKPLLAGPMVAGLGADGLEAMAVRGRAAVGLLVATTDGSTSCDLVFGSSVVLESHRDVEIRSVQGALSCALDGHFLLVGDPDSVRSGIDARREGTGIDTSSRFRTARSRLDGDQIGLAYVDGKALVALVEGVAPPGGLDSAVRTQVADWVVVGLRATDDALQIEMQAAPIPEVTLAGSVPADPPPARSRFAPMLPDQTLAFLEAHGVGANLQRALAMLKTDANLTDAVAQIEQALTTAGGMDNVAGWIEDLGVAVIPTDAAVGGVVLVRGADRAAVTSRRDQLHNLLILASIGTDITVRDTDHAGVTITSVDLGDLGSLLPGLGADSGISGTDARLELSMAVKDDVLVVAIGDAVIERVLDATPATSVGSTGTYRRAIGLAGSPNDVEIYVALDGLVKWITTNLPSDMDPDRWNREFMPYLDHLAAFGEASLTTDTGGSARLVITVK